MKLYEQFFLFLYTSKSENTSNELIYEFLKLHGLKQLVWMVDWLIAFRTYDTDLKLDFPSFFDVDRNLNIDVCIAIDSLLDMLMLLLFSLSTSPQFESFVNQELCCALLVEHLPLSFLYSKSSSVFGGI